MLNTRSKGWRESDTGQDQVKRKTRPRRVRSAVYCGASTGFSHRFASRGATAALAFGIEAARSICNTSALDKAPLLLWMAIKALNPSQMGEDPRRPHKPISKLLEQLEQGRDA